MSQFSLLAAYPSIYSSLPIVEELFDSFNFVAILTTGTQQGQGEERETNRDSRVQLVLGVQHRQQQVDLLLPQRPQQPGVLEQDADD